LLGPPGSGKGTQAARICTDLQFSKISIGDMLRESIKKKDEMGKKAKRYLAKGKLLPDELVFRMVKREIMKIEKGNIVFDGFPRNVSQAESLDSLLESMNKEITRVLYFDVPYDVLVRRLSLRRICPRCGEVYNIESTPPRVEDTCDKCKSRLEMRVDDNAEVVQERFGVYEKETAPLKKYYEDRGLLRTISSSGSKDSIWRSVKQYIEEELHGRSEHTKGVNEK
jgi:adenylate kinase